MNEIKYQMAQKCVAITLATLIQLCFLNTNTYCQETPEIIWDWEKIIRTDGIFEEIGIVERYQLSQIKDPIFIEQNKLETRMMKVIAKANGTTRENYKKAREKAKQIQAESSIQTRKYLQEKLSPSQFRRFEQLAFWSKINRVDGFLKTVCTEPVNEALEIDDVQLKNIKSLNGALQQEFEQRLSLLREKYREKLFAELKENQRDDLKKTLGSYSTIGCSEFKF